MIVIAGGTGRLGSLLTRRLADRGLDVRVITRDPARAGHLRGLPIQIVIADVRDRARIRAALEGATATISAVHGFAGPGRVSPGSVDRDGNANLIDAAAELGVDVVLMSVVGAAADHPMELFRAKHVAEQHLIASNTRWTIVRATAFLELSHDRAEIVAAQRSERKSGGSSIRVPSLLRCSSAAESGATRVERKRTVRAWTTLRISRVARSEVVLGGQRGRNPEQSTASM